MMVLQVPVVLVIWWLLIPSDQIEGWSSQSRERWPAALEGPVFSAGYLEVLPQYHRKDLPAKCPPLPLVVYPGQQQVMEKKHLKDGTGEL